VSAAGQLRQPSALTLVVGSAIRQRWCGIALRRRIRLLYSATAPPPRSFPLSPALSDRGPDDQSQRAGLAQLTGS
ncbi:hypothetical protein, partial [Mycobacterium sp. E2462]|uniref:hypothetical protein n=1 Tax=Mycobacterium sp. E2462 TaxID=1834133 RepID=UPI001E292AA9